MAPWCLTFALGRLENLIFFIQIILYAGHPRFYSFGALGSLQFSLEHSLGADEVFKLKASLQEGTDIFLVPRQTAKETIKFSSPNNEDRNPPINNSLREDLNTPINTKQGAIYTVMQSVDTIA